MRTKVVITLLWLGLMHMAKAVVILPFTWEVDAPLSPGQAPGGVNISYDQENAPITLTISTEPLLVGQNVKTLYWSTEFNPEYSIDSWEGGFSSPTVSYGSYEVQGRTFNTKVSFPDNNFTSGDTLTFSLQSPFLAIPTGDSWALAEIGNASGGSSYYQTAVPEPESIAVIAGIGLFAFGIIRRRLSTR